MSVIDSLSLGGTTYSLRDNDGRAIIAGTESSTTSAHAYSAGDYFILNDTLYEATAAIAVGGTITVGTNCQATTVCGEVGQLKSEIAELDDASTAYKNTLIEGKIKVESNSAQVLLEGKNLLVSAIPSDAGMVIKGRNRFNIASAVFTLSGYSSAQTLTKENNGIKVVCTNSSTSTYLYAYTEYVAEYDGDLYFSCEADCDGRDSTSVQDLRARISINGESQELLYGKGLLFERATVQQGDTVRVSFYTHAGTGQGNTVYYKNIMLAYGGLYDFVLYAADVAGEVTRYKVKTVTDLDKLTWTSRSASTSGYYCTTSNTPLSDMKVLPGDNNTIADISVNGPLSVVTYNQTFNQNEGIAVSSTGNFSIYHEGMGKDSLVAWLEQNPITVTYTSSEQETITIDLLDRVYHGGEIVTFTEATPFAYYRDQTPKNLKAVCFGDSITGMFGNHADYPTMIDLTTNITAINAGFSGCRWTDHSSASYTPFCMNRLADAIYAVATGEENPWAYQDASSLVDPESANYAPLYAEHLANLKVVDWETVDFVTLFWGLNDFYSSVIVNSSDDTSVSDKQHTNVEDAVKYTIEKLLTAYPNLRIIVVTPYWCTTSGVDTDVAEDSHGKKLIDFVNKITDVSADVYHVPVIPMYKTTGANIINKYYFQKDDAHPTERLKWIIAHRIINAIRLDS